MFSGIVEEAAPVVKLEKEKDNLHITMECSFTNELKIDFFRYIPVTQFGVPQTFGLGLAQRRGFRVIIPIRFFAHYSGQAV